MKGQKMIKKLVEHSQQAYLLSLDTFNRISIEYRIEGFCFFIINSWELLLKAKLIQTTGYINSIYYPKERNREKRSLSLEDCLKRIFTDETNLVRKNISAVNEIRNSAVHLLVPELESVYFGLFQSCVLNYSKYLYLWFNISFAEKYNPSIMSLASIHSDNIINPGLLKNKYDKNIVQFILGQQEKINSTSTSVNNQEYSIPLEYKFVLTKDPKSADISFSNDPNSDKKAVYVSVAKDINTLFPYNLTDLVKEINSHLSEHDDVNTYDLQAIIYKEKIKKKGNLCYFFARTNSYVYSEACLQLIKNKIEKDPNFIKNAKNIYKRRNKK